MSDYWYHAIPMPDGTKTPGWAPLSHEAYAVPDAMPGEYVADIGSWDGYWAIHAAKTARYVVAIDNFSDTLGRKHNIDRSNHWAHLRYAKKAWNISNISEVFCDVENWNRSCGFDMEFDRVFMFGVLYHLRNPLAALQNCFSALKSGGVIHVETAILDGTASPYTHRPHDSEGCYAEFYPRDEYGSNPSNWFVPTLRCAGAWLDACGFVDIEMWRLTDSPKSLAECRGFLRARKP